MSIMRCELCGHVADTDYHCEDFPEEGCGICAECLEREENERTNHAAMAAEDFP